MNDLQREIQKRHTLNWLIQGAAQHAGMTFHHLVRDELDALDPGLVPLYDKYALINLLQYWQADGALLLGWPPRFWSQAATQPNHPFFGHALLAKYGGLFAEAGRKRALERSKEKGLTHLPLVFSFQALAAIQRLRTIEAPHRAQLVRLAKRTASMVWGIALERLDGELTDKIVLAPGMLPVRNTRGAMFRAGIVGYGCVARRGEQLVVVGRGTNWQLLAKELVKGTAELICLHGLNQLSEETYREVLEVTDHLDVEPWMLQSGGELWRRVLAALPDGLPVAKLLMHLARLPAGSLELVVATMIERPEEAAREMRTWDDA